jgi:hypothetical protein
MYRKDTKCTHFDLEAHLGKLGIDGTILNAQRYSGDNQQLSLKLVLKNVNIVTC